MGLKFIAVLLAGLFFSPSVSAVSHCGDREAAITILDATYKEILVARGISMAGELIELFISSQRTVVGNTWTITATNPRTKILCMISAGSMWKEVAVTDKATR